MIDKSYEEQWDEYTVEYAKELEQMGLAVPQITRVFNRLKAMGVEINDDVYTTKYAKELLLKLLADKKITARNEPN